MKSEPKPIHFTGEWCLVRDHGILGQVVHKGESLNYKEPVEIPLAFETREESLELAAALGAEPMIRSHAEILVSQPRPVVTEDPTVEEPVGPAEIIEWVPPVKKEAPAKPRKKKKPVDGGNSVA